MYLYLDRYKPDESTISWIRSIRFRLGSSSRSVTGGSTWTRQASTHIYIHIYAYMYMYMYMYAYICMYICVEA